MHSKISAWHIDAAESHAGDFRVGISLSQVVQLCIKYVLQVVQLSNIQYVLQRCHYSSLLAAFVSLTCSFETSVFLKLCVCLTVIKNSKFCMQRLILTRFIFISETRNFFAQTQTTLCAQCAITQCVFPRKLMLSKILQCIGR